MYQGTQFNAYLEKKTPDKHINLYENLINKFINIFIYLNEFIMTWLSTRVVAVSRFAASEGLHLYKRNIEDIIYEGATPLPKSKIKYGGKKNYVNLLSVSRITPYKGFHNIIKIINGVLRRDNIIYTIAGSSPKKQYLQYLKKIGGKNIKIIINPPDKSLARIYQSSDIYVNADRYLFFGLPIIEAAHFGIPVVSFNFGAAKELIQHNKTGYIAKNAGEFEVYLQKLINNNKLRIKFGQKSMLWSQQFSWEKCAAQWEKLLYKYSK